MKSLFANISLVVLLNVLVKPAWLLVEMKVQDVIGHEKWATYAALLSLGFLFITLSDLGINQYATKTLASERADDEEGFAHLLGIKLVLTVLYPIFMLGVGWILRYTWAELQLLFWLCLIQGGNQMMMFFRARFQAAQRFKMDGWLSVVDRIALLIIVGTLFLTRLDMGRFVFARLAAVSIAIILMYSLSVRLFGWTRPRLQLPETRKVLKLSLSFALMTILYSIHDKVDQVMLERMYPDPTANGLYVAAYRWLDAFSMYLWTVLPIFFARFAYFLHDLKEQRKLLHFGQVMAALPMIFVGGFVLTYGDLLLFPYKNSTPEELTTIHTCLKWLFVAAIFNGVFAVFS
ncbi:MAG: oligosaccharide flippase family protein, partial [Bacteroidota bacterium]